MKYFLMAATLVGGVGLEVASAQESVSVGMATGVNQVTSLVAEARGFFVEEGIDVKLMPVARGNLAIEAIATGSMQFAEVSDVAFLSAVDAGIDLVVIGAGSRGFTGKMVAAGAPEGIATLADMKGMRIGIQVGTGVHGVFLMQMEREGLSEADFEISNVRVADMPAAMATRGGFDAVFGWDPMMQRIVAGGYGTEVISAAEFQDLAGITYPLLLVSTPAYVESNPETVQRFVNGYARAHDWISENPDGALSIYMAAIQATGATLEEDIVRNMMFEVEKFNGVHLIDSDLPELSRTYEFLKTRGQLSRELDVEALMLPNFGQAAVAALR
jgi:NitT/TauT family transport system substrate-binding protein